ncbi:MAG TPA: phage head-tail connector protein [Firmicutes bacterium]|nr:phage head-tail connector protein [Bacillota bacterium]
MTFEEKMAVLKILVGGEDADNDSRELLSAYLSIAGSKIISRAYPYQTDITDVPQQYDLLQVEIAAYLINKRGAEGQTAHSENGISRSYENADVPESMMRTVTPFCGVVG